MDFNYNLSALFNGQLPVAVTENRIKTLPAELQELILQTRLGECDPASWEQPELVGDLGRIILPACALIREWATGFALVGYSKTVPAWRRWFCKRLAFLTDRLRAAQAQCPDFRLRSVRLGKEHTSLALEMAGLVRAEWDALAAARQSERDDEDEGDALAQTALVARTERVVAAMEVALMWQLYINDDWAYSWRARWDDLDCLMDWCHTLRASFQVIDGVRTLVVADDWTWATPREIHARDEERRRKECELQHAEGSDDDDWGREVIREDWGDENEWEDADATDSNGDESDEESLADWGDFR